MTEKFEEATHLLKAAQELCRSGAGHEDWKIAEAIDLIEEDDPPTAWNAREAAGILTGENHHKNVQIYDKPYRTGALRTVLEEAVDILNEIANEDENAENE